LTCWTWTATELIVVCSVPIVVPDPAVMATLSAI
jgi:hypothetical protein